MMDVEIFWTAVLERDAARNGCFLFGVMTTGVYCKPSCPARRPLRRNVRFYLTPEAAERDGLRPCLRCRPLETDDRFAGLCAYLRESCEESLTLEDLGKRMNLSPYHLQRAFKRSVGVTPKQYQDACRMDRFKQHLKDGKSVTDAIYEAGYGSPSRLYERSSAGLGMTPGLYRNGAPQVKITYSIHQTVAGWMLVAATECGLCMVELGDSEEALKHTLRKEFPRATLCTDGAPQKWVEALQRHLEGTQPELSLPLDVRLSAFQAHVYDYLRTIPYGETRSYGEVAAGLGRPSAARAVARACAANPVALAVPCHRVVRGNGDPGGYRWGMERKQSLLNKEREKRLS
ncbi:MAG TPA: bifunctional DNA-binding transcriptional regulator/O6-methylguanine-DNA methyltransferase Ada [Bryobacteraceae bacterium]|nr:bifunctional DNA-binding transcriptional regulator/O6-methylguanine-DNA methyltransferase Ada [Bryobacteraceae bacterium]